MSDTILRVFPVDPELVPDSAGAARVVEEARHVFSGRWVDVETTTYDDVVFVDNGQNLTRIVCSRCGREIDFEWWHDRLEEAIDDFQPVPARHVLEVPCCGARVRMDELAYDWPVGFARFVLDIWNPEPWPQDLDVVMHGLIASMGAPLRAIWAHY